MFEEQRFIVSAFSMKDLPKKKLPEVVLFGRSNVGKSSLINSLFNRKDLAKSSRTPGKTRSINFYEIDEKFYLVDLPGYGYAKTSKKERKYWERLITDYLETSKTIKLIIHLIDSRHEPQSTDVKLNNMLKQYSLPYIVLLSKADKLKFSELKKTENKISDFFPEVFPKENLLFYSAIKGRGKKELLALFGSLFYT